MNLLGDHRRDIEAAQRAAERWLPVPGWEGLYEVSDFGRVKSLERVVPNRPGVVMSVREKILSDTPNGSGYTVVALQRYSRRTSASVHRLVLEAFIGPCPPGMEACHNDGTRGNNRLTNLRWDTHSANAIDTVRHGAHSMASKTECVHGHAYTPENTYTYSKTGERHCRVCRADSKKRRRAMKRLALTSQTHTTPTEQPHEPNHQTTGTRPQVHTREPHLPT